MQTVKLQTNIFFVESRPTTQEDNHAGILDRWDVYLSKDDKTSKVGNMVKYEHSYAIFMNMLRFDFYNNAVSFK